MPKYLVKASYTPEGAKGLLKEGGTARRDAIDKLIQNMGGTLESFYFAFGESDVYAIADLPDNATAAAIALTINSAGAAQQSTVVLMTPEEVDAAANQRVDYQPPGA